VRESGPDPAGDAPYFFLSYAHTPRQGRGQPEDPDVWTTRLFRDLTREVRSQADLPPGTTAGFMDHGLIPGDDWSLRLSQALATCRVFVPLYSPRYFQSEHCGKEWAAFARRVANHETASVSSIIPALWVKVAHEKMPSVAQAINFRPAELGTEYASRGFYGIMKISRYRDAYQQAVTQLARRIVAAAEATSVGPAADADYAVLPSAFGTVPSMRGDQRFRITIVAPGKSGLPAGRNPKYYGAVAGDWNPYRPVTDRTLAEHVADLVRSLGYRPDIGYLPERGAELVDERSCVAPEILLIDPWVVRLSEYNRLLAQFDALNKPWVQILIVWNAQDEEIKVVEDEFHTSLDSILGRKIAEGRTTSVLAVRGIPTLSELVRELPAMISHATRQYLKNAPAFPPAGEAVQRMHLSVRTNL
jgi:FxsC-like protein